MIYCKCLKYVINKCCSVYFLNQLFLNPLTFFPIFNFDSNFHVLEEDIAYFRKVFNNSYNANEFYLKDIHGLYIALMEDMTFV